MKAENAYTNYNVRYASNPMDAKHYTTDRLRGEYAIEKVFAPGEVNWTYTMFDRFLIGKHFGNKPRKFSALFRLFCEHIMAAFRYKVRYKKR